ncbi:hypothetical protein DXT97_10540 [Agrobacterium tumefaciens]|uniref:hypothetical protein n=1 Tax=Agrobacterium tumefaciens TaxID=358 RepID=UPI001295BDF2|nr:hypothetical protein [Agrobacterium tumefaciens]MQB37235.1 hypothetical protein [Agrobacterium tumefaciens]
MLALLCAVIGGDYVALLLTQARWIEALFYPITLNTLQDLKSAERHHADLLRTTARLDGRRSGI